MPLASQLSRDLRVGDSDYDGVDDVDVPANGSVDYYRGGSIGGSTRLFSSPYHKYLYCTFWGSEEDPEILLTDDPMEESLLRRPRVVGVLCCAFPDDSMAE